jgi:peptidoglycan/xylan/chitin deacetylase (PgdA/CDA1 family)
MEAQPKMSRSIRHAVIALASAAIVLTAASNPSLSHPNAEESEQTFHWPAGKRVAVSLSFDDARLSQIDRGLDVLNPTGVKVTFFVLPEGVKQRLAGWKRAVASGHEIASHSLNHPCTGNFPWSFHNALENYTLEQMSQQLDEANAEMQRLLGVRMVTFAYPCGQKFVGRGSQLKSYVPLVAEKFLVGRGFYDEYFNDPAFCDLAQASGTVFDDMDYIQMVRLIAQAAKQGAWIIFAGHEIGEKAFQVTDATALAALCRYMQDPANGIWVDTVERIGRYVQQQRGEH